jgi:hypothetical protein
MRKEPGRDGCHIGLVLIKDHPSDRRLVRVVNLVPTSWYELQTHALEKRPILDGRSRIVPHRPTLKNPGGKSQL